MSDYGKHRGHLIGNNSEGKAKCFQCGVVLHERYYNDAHYGCPTRNKPDVTSAWKPDINEYFYSDDSQDDPFGLY